MADQDQEHYEEQHRRWYAQWVRRQYDGPGCRAKIVGRVKYEQIVQAVRGELRRAADNSKFRFWVRAKGFRMGRPAASDAAQVDDADSLYVVDTRNSGLGVAARESRQQHLSYKKVAVVDEFFDIIYRVHCSGGDISARHSGQKRTHRMIMETYAFLPREAVTAFLMGCPQCTTNMSKEHPLQLPSSQSAATTAGLCLGANVDQWSVPFACSTPVKSDAENPRGTDFKTAASADARRTALNVPAAVGPDKENVSVTLATSAAGNRRKRAVPLKRRPCQVIATSGVTVTSASGGDLSNNTLKNSCSSSTNSSCTLVLSSPPSSSLSSRTEHSSVSRSSGWSKWGMSENSCSLRTGACGAGGSSDLSCVASNVQPMDLSSSPAISPAPTMAILSSSSATEDFFYKRKRVRRRRVRPKRLNRSCLGRYDGYHAESNDTSVSDGDVGKEEARIRHSDCDVSYAVSRDVSGGANVHGVKKTKFVGERDSTGCAGEEDDGPKPAKIKKMLDEHVGDNNNDDDYFDKTAAAVAALVTTTTVAVKRTTSKVQLAIGNATDNSHVIQLLGEFEENNGVLSDESEKIQEKSAPMHSPMNKKLNGGTHHPYHMHSRSIMNGLATSSSPSSLSKTTLDTITTSSAAHHNFHRHWLDMASDSVINTNLDGLRLMDVDGSTDDKSMAAAAAAAAAALLFSPPSSVGNGVSPGGPLSSLHPNSHLTNHHALSPLAPLALPPHSAASVGLTSAHHHHHIQQQLQQYAAAAVAAATAAAAAAAAASTSGDSTSQPPTLTLPSMAHHYNQNNNISGSSKRRSTGGASLTVQQQLYRRSGTPTSSTISSPSPMPLNSKNDADTTTSSSGLHENGSFSASGPPTTTTTVLWPPLGLLTAAHQQHHHSLSSPPKFQQLFGSSVNSFTAVTAGSQILSSLPPPPISSPSPSSYRTVSKETNGMAVTTSNGTVTGNDIETGTGNTINADEEDTAIDDDEDEEDEEDDEEEEDLDDDDIEEGEEDCYEDEECDKTVDGSHAQTRRMRRQQVRRLRRLQRASNATNNANDCADSGVSTNYQQQWQQLSTTTSTASSQQQNQQLIGSSSQQSVDPERLKAFNMFVRLFVDENLDRQVPISRQPKDKVQAIIDSCGRQFPELSDRSRKRIRTYLKSCRRNKRNTPQSGSAVSSSPPPSTNPWPANGSSTDSTVQPRPTPAHLTSAQAETILAVACQRESDNARRMRLGLEPVAQPYPYSVATTSASSVFQQPAGTLLLNQNGNGVAVLNMSSTSSDDDAGVGDSSFDKSSSNAIEADTEHHNGNGEIEVHDGHDRREGSISAPGGNGDIADANNPTIEESNSLNVNCGISVTSSSPNNIETAGPTDLSVNKSASATAGTGTAVMPTSAGAEHACSSGLRGLSSMTSTTTFNHRRTGGSSSNSSSMMQVFPAMAAATSSGSAPVPPSLLGQPAQTSSKLLNKADVVTVRQLIAGYRESAAFLLRSADELEHLLLMRG